MSNSPKSSGLLPILGLATIVGGGAGAAVGYWMRPSVQGPTLEEIEALLESSPDQSERMDEIVKQLEAMRRDMALEPSGVRWDAGSPLTESAAGKGPKVSGDAPPLTEEEQAQSDAEKRKQTLDGWFELLAAGDMDFGSMSEIWEKASKEGMAEDLLNLFLAKAEGDPNNPDVQVELGDAYIQLLQTYGGNGAKVAVAGTNADKAYDRALALDENHLDARRNKAIALSFWPAITGKRAIAIQEFETLITLQAKQPLDPSHQSAYLLLGNMHQQSGDLDKAREVWQQALALFPGDETIMAQLAAIGE